MTRQVSFSFCQRDDDDVLDAGGAGIQVGTAFALCDESGMAEEFREGLLRLSVEGESDVITDRLASPTGFPFKVAGLGVCSVWINIAPSYVPAWADIDPARWGARATTSSLLRHLRRRLLRSARRFPRRWPTARDLGGW